MLSAGWFAVATALVLAALTQSGLLVVLTFLGASFLAMVTLGARYCLAGVSFARSVETRRLFPDELTDVEWRLHNAKLLPLAWVHLEEECSDGLEVVEGVHAQPHLPGRQKWIHLYTLRPFERVRHRIRVRARHRGIYSLGPALVRGSDAFGFSLRRRGFGSSEEIVVYPRTHSLPSLGLPVRHPFGDLRSRRWILHDPLLVVGARELRAGDSMRSIHWKATARTQRLHRKVTEASSQPVFVVILDLSPTTGVRYESVDPRVAEDAIEMAASIVRWACGQGVRVGLRSGGFEVKPSSHPRQLTRLLDALARVTTQATGSAARLFESVGDALPMGATVVVVTATCPPELWTAVASWRKRGVGVSCIDFTAKNRPRDSSREERSVVASRMRMCGARYWDATDLGRAEEVTA